MEKTKLRTPDFCSISQLLPMQHCYNIYGKIVELKVEKKENVRGDEIVIATGVLADSSGKVNFRLKNEHTKLLKKDAVIALRNGRANLVDEYLLLELDKFGKVTSEPDQKITPNLTNDVSGCKWRKQKVDQKDKEKK